MAAEPDRLRTDTRPARTTSEVRFDTEAGVVIRRTRLFEDGELASESVKACSLAS